VVTPSSNVDDAEHRPSALRWRRVWRLSTRIPLYSRPGRRGRREAKQPIPGTGKR
jgi:hypothetical protein